MTVMVGGMFCPQFLLEKAMGSPERGQAGHTESLGDPRRVGSLWAPAEDGGRGTGGRAAAGARGTQLGTPEPTHHQTPASLPDPAPGLNWPWWLSSPAQVPAQSLSCPAGLGGVSHLSTTDPGGT